MGDTGMGRERGVKCRVPCYGGRGGMGKADVHRAPPMGGRMGDSGMWVDEWGEHSGPSSVGRLGDPGMGRTQNL